VQGTKHGWPSLQWSVAWLPSVRKVNICVSYTILMNLSSSSAIVFIGWSTRLGAVVISAAIVGFLHLYEQLQATAPAKEKTPSRYVRLHYFASFRKLSTVSSFF
jgi:hypothetical protein